MFFILYFQHIIHNDLKIPLIFTVGAFAKYPLKNLRIFDFGNFENFLESRLAP
jgi:hypothetical protein